jgi:heat shock protein HslJ
MRGMTLGIVVAMMVLCAACSSSGSGRAVPGTTTSTVPAGATSTPPGASAGAQQLQGPAWSLTSSNAFTVPAQVDITATFANGTVGGASGCNSYSGSYDLHGNRITIGTLTTTRILCAPPVMGAEHAYLRTLVAAQTFVIEMGGTLQIVAGQGHVLDYGQQAQSVVGAWNVTGYLNHAATAIVAVIRDTHPTAVFAATGTVSGSTGCNTYRGGYEVNGASISIGPLASTRKLCPEVEGISNQEAGLVAALESAKTFSVRGDFLTLLDAHGQLVVDLQRTS